MSLKYGILGLIAENSLHGYEVKSRFESLMGGSWEVNPGQLYTTLQRLERDCLIEPVGERGDRGRLAYRATDAGRAALRAWLVKPELEPQQLRAELYVKLMLLTQRADGDLPFLVARQRHAFLQRLRDLADQERAARLEGRQDLLLLVRGAVLHTEADLRWLDACEDTANALEHGGSSQ